MLKARRVGLAACCGLAACTTLLGPQPERLPDGSYRASCKAPLRSCLEPFERICEWHGYDVITASEARDRTDARGVSDLTIKSEAQVRCKEGEPIFRSP